MTKQFLLVITIWITFFNAQGAIQKWDLANYRFGERVDDQKFEIEVQYQNIESIEIRVYDYNPEKIESHEAESNPLYVVKQFLEPEVTQYIDSVLAQIGDAEITSIYSEMVCHLYPVTGLMYIDNLMVRQDSLEGDLVLVQGPKGCHISNKVFLENMELNTLASELKVFLKDLANEILEEETELYQ